LVKKLTQTSTIVIYPRVTLPDTRVALPKITKGNRRFSTTKEEFLLKID